MSLSALVRFVQEWRTASPAGMKDALVAALIEHFSLEQDGALLVGSQFVVRVSQNSADAGFPNAVVALKKIVKYDDRPVIVCLITPNRCVLLLANTTFLRKVSHSSHSLAEHKLVGSILGSDVLPSHEGTSNTPDNFARLWKRHQQTDRASNLLRIITATRARGSAATMWFPSPIEIERILAAPQLAYTISGKAEYARIAMDLDAGIQLKRSAILAAACDPNHKTRGDRIESIVTGVAKNQGLGDLTVQVLTSTISIDVKAKRLDLSSAPKAYNVDKVLHDLSAGNRLLAILFVGVDPTRDLLNTRLVSMFDRTLLAAVRLDPRWSGRGTRGTVQFSGDLGAVWRVGFRETIDVAESGEFLRRLIDHPPASARD